MRITSCQMNPCQPHGVTGYTNPTHAKFHN